jgi:hypothetical protein
MSRFKSNTGLLEENFADVGAVFGFLALWRIAFILLRRTVA